MNILHMRYALEVAKTGSMTQAADNLFMGQPNLSRAIKELEDSLGTKIFKRTSKGILPTKKGEEFLSYAKSIVLQIDNVEKLFKKDKVKSQCLNISIPRASYITSAFTEFVKNLDLSTEIEFNFKETNSMEAIKNITDSNYNLGIIRYQNTFEDYFLKVLKEKGLKSETIWEFNYLVLMSRNHPLADKASVSYSDLTNFVEIAHGDISVPALPLSEVKKIEHPEFINKRIYVYERASQFELLCDVPFTYMWVSPIPQKLIDRHHLIQKKCREADRSYKDVLIYDKNYKFTDMDNRFIDEIIKSRAIVTK